jgi:hypothetical protein
LRPIFAKYSEISRLRAIALMLKRLRKNFNPDVLTVLKLVKHTKNYAEAASASGIQNLRRGDRVGQSRDRDIVIARRHSHFAAACGACS